MPTYTNGNIPRDLLVSFASGYNKIDGNWEHLLPKATYHKHLNLVELARRRTGKLLRITDGWGAYRPLHAQVTVRAYYASIGQPLQAAWPGTSSHGGLWEGKRTAAMDYDWGNIYGWNRENWYADVRAAGLHPGLIHPSRNDSYPDEPWHVIDLDPWGAVPKLLTEAAQPKPVLEGEEMNTISWKGHIFTVGQEYIKYETTSKQASFMGWLLNRNDRMTSGMMHVAVGDAEMNALQKSLGLPWEAVDAVMKGVGFNLDGSRGNGKGDNGRIWSRSLVILSLLGGVKFDTTGLATDMDTVIKRLPKA